MKAGPGSMLNVDLLSNTICSYELATMNSKSRTAVVFELNTHISRNMAVLLRGNFGFERKFGAK